MACPPSYIVTEPYIHEQSFPPMEDLDETYIDPKLQNPWTVTKSSVQRYLADTDQSPALFDTISLSFPYGVGYQPLSIRQISPPRTSFSCSDSCESPSQDTDFPLPQSPPLTDCISPLLHHMDHNSSSSQLNYYGTTGYQASTFGPSSSQDTQEDPAGILQSTMSGDQGQQGHLPTSSDMDYPYWMAGPDPAFNNEYLTGSTTVYTPIATEDDARSAINVKTEPVEASYGTSTEVNRMATGTPSSSSGGRNPRKRSAQYATTPPAKRTQRFDRTQPQSDGAYTCEDCNKPAQFKDEHSLLKHRKTQHTRPFTCVYHFAGCTSTFATKNEWKRHVTSQHIILHYWICTEGPCAKVANNNNNNSNNIAQTNSSPHAGCPSLPNGTIFNRKDLYTQHLRRMHVPSEFKKQLKQKNSHIPEWEKQVKAHQKAAVRLRCDLPEYMECPVESCTATFTGSNSWDERMEHVARHLDIDTEDDASVNASRTPEVVEFGGANDLTLLNWSVSPEVAVIRLSSDGRSWELNNPLRTSAGPRKPSVGRARRTSSVASNKPASFSLSAGSGGDQDAEGEDDDTYV